MTPRDRLAELAARLRAAGLRPTAEELADAVWLARWTTSAPAADGADGLRQQEDPAAPPAPAPGEEPAPPGDGERPARGAERSGPVSLHVPVRPDSPAAHAFPVRAPAAGAVSGLLGLQRALRPLQTYRPPLPRAAAGRLLDEAATAEQGARRGVVRPVFRPAERRECELQLLMDAADTVSVWEPLLERLRQACERVGAFRDVQVRHLHRGPDGEPRIGTGPDPAPAGLRPPDQYRDTTGRRLTLVVSDCVGPLWREGAAQRLLYRWATGAPLAVVQPLPPRLWQHTALPAEPGTLVREPGGGGFGLLPDGYGPAPPPGAVPVPVLLPTPRALGSWAWLLGGSGRRTARGAAAWVLPDHPARPAPPPESGPRTPEARLRAFRATASPGAFELAVHLTPVPLVLPVIRLVQETMLPHTGPAELAEVLLGGLLERLPDIEGAPGPRYDFAPGVADRLQGMLDQDVAALLLKHVSEYVTRNFGRGVRNFPALAVDRLTGRARYEAGPDLDRLLGDEAGEAEDPGDELFAEIPARVVRRYLPVRPVPDLLDDAERLLLQWRSQHDRQSLRQALALADSAVAADGGERARLLLGQVLRAAAQAGAGTGPARRRELLRRAAGLLTGGGTDTALERAAVCHELWLAERDPAWLREAEEVLRSLAGRDGEPPRTERVRRLRLGRVLLETARAEGGSRAAAAAARELRAACELLEATGAAPRRRCAALLDLVAAERLGGAHAPGELSALLDRADRAADAADGDDLRLRCLLARAAVHRDAGDWEAAGRAYDRAESHTLRDSPERCELLLEWGGMLLDRAGDPDRAEGLLREALTGAPDDAPLQGRLHLMLGRALLERHRRERFLPDLYEGCDLLEHAARRASGPAERAEAWLALGGARRDFPDSGPGGGSSSAEAAYDAALREARQAPGQPRAPVTAARALHGRGVLYERLGRPGAALADYRASEAEWRRLAERGAVPAGEAEEELRAVRGRMAEIEAD
ncbi:SAV_2336 N-terminal domain-related protein [Streptomyces sp. TRM 70361]|uniref:SAV_2336 N-terminal domain-related protein n=1 Tax=Streptomyces sp. TRM 70361 TaxID=3116553 RepID=UPI002E7B5218|nr:SAV_2336 N-terminal domain-related protein [Streptomyces sp. TRM 70361]MEE1938813.1 SAV_2336 N-terminal domain-related protein [Streptomyces sp. TRM 70361]